MLWFFTRIWIQTSVRKMLYEKHCIIFDSSSSRYFSINIFSDCNDATNRRRGEKKRKEVERICMFIRENLSAFLRTELLLKMPPQQLKLKIIKTLQLFLNGCHAYTFLIWFGIQFTKYTNFSLRCNQLKSCQNLVLVPVTFPIIIYKFLFYLEIEYFDTLITSLYSHTRW